MYFKIIILLFVYSASGQPTGVENPFCWEHKDDNILRQETVDSLNEFSRKLRSLLIDSNNKQNLVYSSLSAYYLLSLIAYGTWGTTIEQLISALGLPDKYDRKNSNCLQQDIRKSLTIYKNVENITLSIGNAVIAGRNVELTTFYSNLAKNVFYAQLLSNYGTNLKLHDLANQWVDQITDHNIQKIIEEGSVDDNNDIIIANAIYFNAKWAIPFTEDVEKSFFDFNNQPKRLEMLAYDEGYLENGYLFNGKLRFVILPYKNENYKFVVVWPFFDYMDAEEFTEYGKKLSSIGYSNIIKNDSLIFVQDLKFYMPKFKIESELDFEPILTKMGVTSLFNNGDFKFMIENQEQKRLKIVQKAYITVDRAGTAAAAASTVGVIPLFGGSNEVIVNRPFYYAIVSPEGSLFEGHVIDPQY